MQKPWRWWRDSPRYLHIGGPWSFSSWDHAERFFWSIDLLFFHKKKYVTKKIVIKKFVRICVQYHAESVYIIGIHRENTFKNWERNSSAMEIIVILILGSNVIWQAVPLWCTFTDAWMPFCHLRRLTYVFFLL